jgi:membrane protein DedA with SNARE-associated domain
VTYRHSLLWVSGATLLGCLAGALWPFLVTDGYEATDSAIGTALLCGALCALVAAVAVTYAGRKRR